MRKEMEVMRVLRVPPLGKLVVDLGGNRFMNLAEIPEPEVKRRILAAIGDLMVFAGGYQKLVEADVAPPLAAAVQPAAPVLVQTRDLAPTESPTEKNAAPTPRPVVSTGPFIEPASSTMVSIASQIDGILQGYVEADSALAGRSIHLKQSPNGGLIIVVDGQAFKRPNEIEEKTVRDVIKRALKEWERA